MHVMLINWFAWHSFVNWLHFWSINFEIVIQWAQFQKITQSTISKALTAANFFFERSRQMHILGKIIIFLKLKSLCSFASNNNISLRELLGKANKRTTTQVLFIINATMSIEGWLEFIVLLPYQSIFNSS